MSDHIDSFLMALEPPVRVLTSNEEHVPGWNNVAFDGKQFSFEYPMGLSFPDILYDSTTNTFTGLIFNVASSVAGIKSACATLDKRNVRFHDKTSSVAAELDLLNSDSTLLEISWLRVAKLAYEPAQLANIALWFTPDYCRLMAFELWDIRHHLTGYDLKVPDLSSVYPPLVLDNA